MNNSNMFNSDTSNSIMYNLDSFAYSSEQIVSVTLKNGKLEIVKRVYSNLTYTCNPPRPAPDRVKKEIYAAVNGNIELVETIHGKHIPASYNQEQILFD